MNAKLNTSKIVLVTMLLGAFAAGCSRHSPDSSQASSGSNMSGTDTTTASTAKSSDASGTSMSGAKVAGADASLNSTGNSSGTSGSSGSSGSSDSSASSGSSDSSGASSSSSGASDTGSTASKAGAKAGAAVDDGMMTAKIKAALLADPDIKSSDISVETKKGDVMLSGFVKSQTQVDRALQIARNVDGVKDVQNKMTVRQ